MNDVIIKKIINNNLNEDNLYQIMIESEDFNFYGIYSYFLSRSNIVAINLLNNMLLKYNNEYKEKINKEANNLLLIASAYESEELGELVIKKVVDKEIFKKVFANMAFKKSENFMNLMVNYLPENLIEKLSREYELENLYLKVKLKNSLVLNNSKEIKGKI